MDLVITCELLQHRVSFYCICYFSQNHREGEDWKGPLERTFLSSLLKQAHLQLLTQDLV